MKPTTKKLASGLLAISLFAAACGSDDDPITDAVGDAADTAGDVTEGVVDDAADTAGDLADDAADTAGDLADEAADAAEDAVDDATDAAEDVVDGDNAEAGSIVDVATANGSFTTLLAALEAADLTETLSGEGSFTVFAPTDDAFAGLLEELDITADELLAREDLSDILTFHVLDEAAPSSEVAALDGSAVETLNGAEITITVDGETIAVNDIEIVTADVAADNGVIHVIDSVLLPPEA